MKLFDCQRYTPKAVKELQCDSCDRFIRDGWTMTFISRLKGVEQGKRFKISFICLNVGCYLRELNKHGTPS